MLIKYKSTIKWFFSYISISPALQDVACENTYLVNRKWTGGRWYLFVFRIYATWSMQTFWWWSKTEGHHRAEEKLSFLPVFISLCINIVASCLHHLMLLITFLGNDAGRGKNYVCLLLYTLLFRCENWCMKYLILLLSRFYIESV